MATQKIYNILLFLQFAGVAVALAIAWHWPLLGDKPLGRIENRLRQIGERRGLSIAAICLLLIAARLAVLPLTGVPVPQVHDAFSYMLASDTFVHGRLANPPHPMGVYLQSFHEIQSPTYMSKYPPATGAVLAIGQKLGHPWIGVLLSVAVMCGVITWALQGWLPSSWALLGGILAVAGFAGANEWTSGYTDGPVAAIGGALMIGAFPRILLYYRSRHAMLLALGIGILANSRPYEGTAFSAVTVLVLGLCLIKKRNLRWPKLLLRVVAPLAGVLIVVGAFMAYYNWRVTRNPFLPPYQAYTQTFENAPVFLWGTLRLRSNIRIPSLPLSMPRAGRLGWPNANSPGTGSGLPWSTN